MKALENILVKHGINPESYWGGTFIGADCIRLLSKHKAIMKEIRELIRKEGKKDLTETELAEMEDTLFKYEKLLTMFSYIVFIMKSIRQQSDEDIDAFESVCKGFTKGWRKCFPDSSITPKMHILEVHVPKVLRFWGCLGIFNEESIERLHHLKKVAMKRVVSLKGTYSIIQSFLYNQEGAFHSEEVLTVLREVTEAKKQRGRQSVNVEEDEEQVRDERRLAALDALAEINDKYGE